MSTPHATETDATGLVEDVADLERLATALAACGLHTTVRTLPGQLPFLDVRNPRASVLAEKVFAQAGTFWWSWAERISDCEEVAGAAAIVARVLRTVNE
jgi:hypothetical protein